MVTSTEAGTDLFRTEIVVIIPHLEYQTYQICQRQDIVFGRAGTLHQSGCQTKESSGLVRDHEEVFILCRYSHRVAPEQFNTLSTMQIQHFLVVYAESLQRVVQVKELLLCEKVRIVGCVNALGSPKDTVCCREATPQLRAVLNVIDPEKLNSSLRTRIASSRTYRRDAL